MLIDKTRLARREINSRGYAERRRLKMESKIDFWLSVKKEEAISSQEKEICQRIVDRYIKKFIFYVNKMGV